MLFTQALKHRAPTWVKEYERRFMGRREVGRDQGQVQGRRSRGGLPILTVVATNVTRKEWGPCGNGPYRALLAIDAGRKSLPGKLASRCAADAVHECGRGEIAGEPLINDWEH